MYLGTDAQGNDVYENDICKLNVDSTAVGSDLHVQEQNMRVVVRPIPEEHKESAIRMSEEYPDAVWVEVEPVSERGWVVDPIAQAFGVGEFSPQGWDLNDLVKVGERH